MKKKVISALLCATMVITMAAGCGSGDKTETTAATSAAKETEAAKTEGSEAGSAADTEEAAETKADGETAAANTDFAGEELSILVSAGWMDNSYDETIARFEETYGVTVDLQTIPADQYGDLLQSKLTTDSCADIFWIQSNPFAIASQIVDPEKYCIDFSDASWKSVMPENRLSACEYDGKLYGLQIWHNSPEYVMVYNKKLFGESGLEAPKNNAKMLKVCEKL